MIVICDASPLIVLAMIQRLDLLRHLFHEVIIPESVYYEVVMDGAGEPGADTVQAATWLRRKRASDRVLFAQLQQRLGSGEAEAIALAQELKADLVLIDERRGRQVAAQYHLRVVGTIGVLIEAKRQGVISALKPELDRLRASTQMYMDDALYERALHAVGEEQSDG